MTEDVRAALRQRLVAGYEDLRRRLARRLGSVATATEALHETWLRLDGISEIGTVRNPAGLLYRMALQIAIDGYRGDARWLRRAELEATRQEGQDDLTPERIAVARDEIAGLESVLAAMPARRRQIFVAALVEDLPYRIIADRLGVSERLIEREVRSAIGMAGERLDKRPVRRAGRPVGRASHQGKGGQYREAIDD